MLEGPPDDLIRELRKNQRALRVFEAMPPSHRKQYIQWIEEAKLETTRAARIARTIEMLIEKGSST